MGEEYEEQGGGTFRVTALLVCHDIRLSCRVETTASLPAAPSPGEAARMLWAAADEVLAPRGCAECPYELRDVAVVRLAG